MTKLGVKDCVHPKDITTKVIEKEKMHLTDFGEDYCYMIQMYGKSYKFPFKISRWSSERVMDFPLWFNYCSVGYS